MLTKLTQHMKLIKTCNLYLSLFTMGLSFSLPGPCLLDLQHMVNTDTQHIAMIYTARSIGHLAGAILGGITLDLANSKLAVLAACNFLAMLTMFAIPWARNLETLMALTAIYGFAFGTIITGSNVTCIKLWGKDSNPFIQGMHGFFGLGALISPLIAVPFLQNLNEFPVTIDNSTNLQKQFYGSSMDFLINVTNITQTSHHTSKIAYPFSIVGVIALLVVFLYVGVCIISPTEDSVPVQERVNKSDRSCCFMFFTVIFTFLIFFVLIGTEIGYGQTLTTYAVKGRLHATTAVGSYMTSAFWAAFTLGRVASVFLAIKISSFVLIIGDIFIISTSALVLLFLMPNEWALWLATVLFGAGTASAYGALVGWVGTHINVTNKISSIFTIGVASGEMVMPFIIAFFIDILPEIFVYVIVASSILGTVFVIILQCMFKHGKKVRDPKVLECCVSGTSESHI